MEAATKLAQNSRAVLGTLSCADDIFAVARECHAAWPESSVWYRGQSDTRWQLWPSSHRRSPSISDLDRRIQEAVWFEQFTLRAVSRQPACPSHADIPGWLSLMQHHRVPTCLLDWTESLLVAAFFAVANDDAVDGRIWALNSGFMNYRVSDVRLPGRLTIHSSEVRRACEDAVLGRDSKSNKVLAFRPQEGHARMLAQQSTFTVHRCSGTLEQLPTAGDWLRAYDIPAGAKAGFRTALASVGVRESILFPDLDHLASEIS